MRKIFVSYRRRDSAIFVGRIYDRLISYYGTDSIFLDIDSLHGADNFPEVLSETIRKSAVVLAVIGNDWLGVQNGDPQERRIDDQSDFVRLEIEQAIGHAKPIIPVYFGDCAPLTPDVLPSTLKPLASAHAVEISIGRDFDHHLLGLRRQINRFVLPSTSQLVQHFLRRFFSRFRNSIAIALAFLAVVLTFRSTVGWMLLPSTGVHAVIRSADPHIFQKSQSGVFQIARAHENRESLVSETDIVQCIRETRSSFDIFAFTGSVIVNNYEAVKDALSKGARIRVVVVDHSLENESHIRDYFNYCGLDGSGIEWSKRNARQVEEFVQRLYKRSSDKLEVRRWRGPFINSIWIRDSADASNAVGHMEATYYGDVALNPSFRFGRYSPRMIESLQQQFDYIWEHSIPGSTGSQEIGVN